MGAIRRKQISEVLNYDRNMNLRVLGMERKQVATNMQDERTPYVQQDQEGIDNTNVLINNLMVLLDRKRSSTTTVAHETLHGAASERPYARAVSELSMIHEPVNLYNQVLERYLATGSTQHTKEIMLTSIRKLLEPVAFIVKNVHRVLDTYAHHSSRGAGQAYVRKYFDKLVVALAAYHLIEQQLRSGNFYIVTASELQSTLNGLLDGNPTWKRIFSDFKLDPTIRDSASTPFHGPGGGPGPGPGPGGRPSPPPPPPPHSNPDSDDDDFRARGSENNSSAFCDCI